jgi:hypothetical protein
VKKRNHKNSPKIRLMMSSAFDQGLSFIVVPQMRCSLFLIYWRLLPIAERMNR